MAEAFNSVELPVDKAARYAALAEEVASVLEGEPDLTARMAVVAGMLAQSFPHFFWTGFYRVDPARPGELVLGPYQGTLGCLRIPFGKGVCGTAAQRRETVIVEDVHAFPGHIACDAASASELVVPVLRDGAVIAVIDLDSPSPARFTTDDAAGIEALAAMLSDRI